MQEILIKKLHEYIRENNPDMLLQLEENGKVTEYLSSKIKAVDALLQESDKEQPSYIIEEACVDILTEDLRPSKYHYICNILEEEFEPIHQRLQQSGTLRTEVVNLVNHCQPVFSAIGFTEENEGSKLLQNAITGTISEYFENNK